MRVSVVTLAMELACCIGLASLAMRSAEAQSFTSLYHFCPDKGCKDGSYPQSGLVVDAQGNLYGTTESGGADGDGTVFKIAAGKETVLYSFKGGKADGSGPSNASLVRDAHGNLYGVTASGGTNGAGTVFKITSAGEESVLYSFKGAPDGYGPDGGLVMDADANLYGTTLAGGIVNSECSGGKGCGTVFKLSSTKEETVLYKFCAETKCADGGGPEGGMVRDSKGNLYGTTAGGGSHLDGTVFKLSTSGKESVLYSFCAASKCTDGEIPFAGLVMDGSGNLYGATGAGGAKGYGTVFKVTPEGRETVLHSFSGASDGAEPTGSLAIDKAGNLYGTALAGGPHEYGTVFVLNTAGKLTVLHGFDLADGYQPYGAVVLDTKGDLYGTTFYGGNTTGGELGCGTVWGISSADTSAPSMME